ncbi:MAG TPA: hypothetical protein VE643_02290 [Nitrososphaeraceae archaeon]|nr:hypothetical protein [Nitrososphaeraceae archaeon]
MPVFELETLVEELSSVGINCKIGKMEIDIPAALRPYFERWLLNRDGFVKIYGQNVDYIGIEDVVRMGPFFNVYCMLESEYIIENDENILKLLCASPYFNLHNGRVIQLGWSGGLLAQILTADNILCARFTKNIMKEEVRKISVRVANYACIVETQVWEPSGLASIYDVIDRIGLNIRELLKRIHLGEDNDWR